MFDDFGIRNSFLKYKCVYKAIKTDVTQNVYNYSRFIFLIVDYKNSHAFIFHPIFSKSSL